jgi:hypothetical protein
VNSGALEGKEVPAPLVTPEDLLVTVISFEFLHSYSKTTNQNIVFKIKSVLIGGF